MKIFAGSLVAFLLCSASGGAQPGPSKGEWDKVVEAA